MNTWQKNRINEVGSFGPWEVPTGIMKAILIHKTTSQRIVDACRHCVAEGSRRGFTNPWTNVTNQNETLWKRWRGIGPLALQHLEEAGVITMREVKKRERTVPKDWEGMDFAKYILKCAIQDRQTFLEAWADAADPEEIMEATRNEIAAMKERLRRLGK